jgi:cold shock CspA family protein
MTDNNVDDSKKLVGQVKWFNNKSGYGFISYKNENNELVDVFVHHTSINVENEQYKYLMVGEYIEFVLLPCQTGNHSVQAGLISGINGGKIMCETLRDLKIQKNNFKKEKTVQSSNKQSDSDIISV